MDVTVRDTATDVIVLAGDVTTDDLVQLRLDLVHAVEATAPGSDLLVDAHAVTRFDDGCLPAFVAARSRAKWQRQSIAVLADVGSPVEACLRSSGHLARISVYDDLSAAREALREHRLGRRWD